MSRSADRHAAPGAKGAVLQHEKMGGPFTPAAKRALFEASRRARIEDAPELRTDHLLLGLLDVPDSAAAQLLAEFGIPEAREHLIAAFRAVDRRGGLSDSDLDAPAGLGIEVETIVERVEQNLGANALSATRTGRRRGWPAPGRGMVAFSRDMYRTIHSAVIEMKETRSKNVGPEHLLLALLQRPGIVSEVLADYELTYPEARRYLAAHA